MKHKIFALLLALVMGIGLIPFLAPEAHAIEVEATSEGNEAFTGDFTLYLVNKDDPTKTETHTVTYDGTNWSTPKSDILPAHAFAYTGEVTDITYTGGKWSYTPVLQLDQSSAEKLAKADVMIATGEASKEVQLSLEFEHVYAKVTFNISLNSEFVTDTDKVTALTVSSDNDVNAFIGETAAEAIIAPLTYTEGNVFATVTVNNGAPLNVNVPEGGLTFYVGTNYTFDLTVGKDAVTLTPTGTDKGFPGGWSTEVNLDGTTGTIGTADAGKTAWENGDQTFTHLHSTQYGHQTAVMTFEKGDWTSNSTTLKYLKDENPTIIAVYAPDCEIKSDGTIGLVAGKMYGEAEYIPANVQIGEKGELNVSFAGVTRNYSRLRVVGEDGKTYAVTITNFTPAGVSEPVATYEASIVPDTKGNMFLYGTWSAGSTVTVKSGETTVAEHTFVASDFGEDDTVTSSIPGKSYALLACEHAEVNIVYTWAKDNASCTATATCQKCNKATTETVKPVLDTESTDGNYYLHATFTTSEFVAQNRLSYKVTSDTYYVYDSNGLLAWHDQAKNDLRSNLTLEADIDMTNAGNWEPFGSFRNEYTGTVEGNNHTITGLTVNTSRIYVGFIGYLKDGTVKNLHLRDASIKNNYSDSTNESVYTGAIVGYLSKGTVLNCSATGSVSISTTINVKCVGGIVGYSAGKVIGCYNGAAVAGHADVGGIVGYNHVSSGNASTGIVIGCYNVGDITQVNPSGRENAGGIVGCNDTEASILASYNIGSMTNCIAAPGGIVGTLDSGTVADCYWAVDANASKPKEAYGYKNSYSTATVNATKITDGDWAAAMTAMNKAIATWNASNSNLCAYHYELNTSDAGIRPLILVAGAPTAN